MTEDIQHQIAENARLRSVYSTVSNMASDLIDERDSLSEENSRLRADLASSKAAHSAVWAKHQERGQRIFELHGELGRLRKELETSDKIAWQNFSNYKNAVSTIGRVEDALEDTTGTAQDAIERVWAVLYGGTE